MEAYAEKTGIDLNLYAEEEYCRITTVLAYAVTCRNSLGARHTHLVHLASRGTTPYDGGVMWWVQCEQKRAVSRTKLDVDAEPSASAE